MTAWRLDGVSKRFRARWGRPAHPALTEASLRVENGERVGIIGESGAGKTTLARVGLGLIPPDAGTVHLLGEDTTHWRARRWREARSEAQLLFQDPRSMLNAHLTLGQILRESARLHRPEEPARAAAEGVLEAVGLGGRDRAFPRHLSGGELRRAGIARLLLARPRLVVADELTAGLDAAIKASLVELLLEKLGPDCAVVLISHDLPLITWACDRVVVMRQGRIVDEVDATAPCGPHPYTRELLHAAGIACPGEE